MSIPLQVTFRGISESEALRASIEKHAAKLERFSKSILGCHVVVERSEHHHHKGSHYRIRVHLKVEAGDIQASRDPAPQNKASEDPYVAVRDAFDAVRRQLEDHVRMQRGDVKTHLGQSHGRIKRIYKDADYGLLETPDGREIHFHRHSVVDGKFDALDIGHEVRFVEAPGEEGPWASTLHPVGKAHPGS